MVAMYHHRCCCGWSPLVNMVSPRFVGQFDGLLLIAGLMPLLLVATVGWLHVRSRAVPRDLECEWQAGCRGACRNSLALVFWAFTGLESASVAAAVVENPERNVPIATIAGVLHRRTHIYGGQHRDHGPGAGRAISPNSNAPFALAAAKMFGPVAGPLVALCGGMLKALGTLAGWVLHDRAGAAAPPPIMACCRRSSRARAPATRPSRGSSSPAC